MAKFIFARRTRKQNILIIREINMLLKAVAYDGRGNIKVRFRKAQNTPKKYVLDVYVRDFHEASVSLNLQTNPFNIMWFVISKNQIKKGTYLGHCRKSRYGGYTFY